MLDIIIAKKNQSMKQFFAKLDKLKRTINLETYNMKANCNSPTSSVLFDGNIPTLTGLDGDTWASQLMILHQPEFGHYFNYSSFDFSNTLDYRRIRIEVTVFNCPQWGLGTQSCI